MSVDMYESRFLEELNKVNEFIPKWTRDPKVWEKDFPAWRSIFSAACLWMHGCGYRLPGFDAFFRGCKRAYTIEYDLRKDDYKKYFEEPLLEGMTERIGVWYESGMSEAYLYACLIGIIEDKMQSGVVCYDPRVDWKMKYDVMVILNDRIMKISAFHGSPEDRNRIVARRDVVEHARKKKTSNSSHWNNCQVKRFQEFKISRDSENRQLLNGVGLFTIDAINNLLTEIFDFADIHPKDRWFYRDSGGKHEIIQ
jgi:hypothetical protein